MGMRPKELVPELISKAVRVSEGQLFYYASNKARYYLPTRTQVVRGKPRQFDEPRPELKKLFKRLHNFLQERFQFSRAAHGGVRGRSCFTAARQHVGKDHVLTRDISACFPSITTTALRKRLLALGFQSRTAWLLAELMTVRDCIPQGSPLSNDALNFFLFDLDIALDQRPGGKAVFTRMADDCVISSDDPVLAKGLVQVLEEQIKVHGLTVNEEKKAKNGWVESPKRQLMHSIIVNDPRGTRVKDEFGIKAMELADKYVGAARCVCADTLEATAAKRRELAGWLNYCRQARFSPSQALSRKLKTGDNLVRRRLRQAGVTWSRKWWVKGQHRNRSAEYASVWRHRPGALLEIGKANNLEHRDEGLAAHPLGADRSY
jgi:hypothetical protein